MTMAVVLPSNFAFMLPMATPATAMAYSSGTSSPAEAIRRGAIMDLAGVVLLAALIYVYWPTAQALLATYGG
jgi:sodium-dependent dicarboxylate transporter 2/3/5